MEKLITDAVFIKKRLKNVSKLVNLHKLPELIAFSISVNCAVYLLFFTVTVMHYV